MEKIKHSSASVIFLILIVSLIFACFQPQTQRNAPTGVYHLVKRNETIDMIAKAYGVSPQKLIRINNIEDTNVVKEGSVIFIPSASKVIDNVVSNTKNKNTDVNINTKKYSLEDAKGIKVNKDVKEVKSSTITSVNTQNKKDIKTEQYPKTKHSIIAVYEEPAVKTIQNKKSSDENIKPQTKAPIPATEKQNLKIMVNEEPAPNTIQNKKFSDEMVSSNSEALVSLKKMQSGKNRFIWPVQGDIKDRFGVQPNKTFHNWIKIISAEGVKVKAAESGTVIFSSNLKNYGETIIIRHKNNFATVYTHLKKRYVKIDKNIKKGETIAVLGEKDDAGEVYMNFEIRLEGKARNPLLFLP